MMGEWKNLVFPQAYMLGKFTRMGLPKPILLHISWFLSPYKLISTMNSSFSPPSIFIKQHLVLSLSSTHVPLHKLSKAQSSTKKTQIHIIKLNSEQMLSACILTGVCYLFQIARASKLTLLSIALAGLKINCTYSSL